jgi:TPP-dependent pyruvate/acetoin dehydrogenase alpha subunit
MDMTDCSALSTTPGLFTEPQSVLEAPQEQPELAHFLKEMLRIRLFEERALKEHSRGRLSGTTHTCIGQEANAVGILSGLTSSDVVFSNHRGHGHFLARGGDMRALAAELMGKTTGVCGGVGGSQHLCTNNFYSNGIQGGIVPCATGIAAAEKCKGSDSIVVVFLGDGTLGEGVVYESLNIASLWSLPVLYVVENNLYAQTTPISLNLAGSISARFQAFGIETSEVKTTNVVEIYGCTKELIKRIRSRQKPCAFIIETYRLSPHSKGDDTRDPAEVEHYRRFDPIRTLETRISDHQREAIYAQCLSEVELAFCLAESDPLPVGHLQLTLPLQELP